MDKKYEAEYKPLLDYRRDIIRGAKEPTAEEVERGFPEDHKGHVSLTEGERTEIKGIPGFWLRALKNDRRLRELITPRDEACLVHLIDIQCQLADNPNDGYTLIFVFNANEFFEEVALSKNYKLQEDEQELVLEKATGCAITWKKDQNLTMETKRKKQRSKKTKEVRYVTTLEPCDSFFNFFKPPQPGDEENGEGGDGEEGGEDYDQADRVEEDYEAGQIIKERLIMRAVEYFTGEADSGSDDDMDFDEEEEEEEEEEEAPPARGRGGGGRGGQQGAPRGGGGGRGGAQDGKDCKQQ